MAENSGHEQPMPLGVAQSDEGPKKKKKKRKGESRSQKKNPAAEVPSGLEGRAGGGASFQGPREGSFLSPQRHLGLLPLWGLL